MMRRLIVFAALLLAGCGSSPTTHFYTLSVASSASPGGFAPPSPVQVSAVHIPESLDRREMVRATGSNTLSISSQDRWSAPLGDMTRRVLSQDLALQLAPGALVMPDAPAPPKTLDIVVTIAEFGRQADGQIGLVGSWSVVKGGTGPPILRRPISLERRPAGSGPDADAAGMSALLGELATQIAAALPGSH